MQTTGISVVRIAESTWGMLEPKPGVFDFSHVDRVLNRRQGRNQSHSRHTDLCRSYLAGTGTSGCSRHQCRRGRPSTAAARTWISPSHACRLTYGFAERTGFLSVNHATQGGSLSLSTWGVAVMEESAR